MIAFLAGLVAGVWLNVLLIMALAASGWELSRSSESTRGRTFRPRPPTSPPSGPPPPPPTTPRKGQP